MSGAALGRALRAALAAAALLFALPACAGAVFGTHVLFVNLAADPQPFNKRINDYFKAGKTCYDEDSLFYIRTRPRALTPALVRRAMLERDPAALARLQQIFLQPYDAAANGFDGLIVYTDQPAPQLLALTSGRKKIAREPVGPASDKDALGTALCEVTPPIARRP